MQLDHCYVSNHGNQSLLTYMRTWVDAHVQYQKDSLCRDCASTTRLNKAQGTLKQMTVVSDIGISCDLHEQHSCMVAEPDDCNYMLLLPSAGCMKGVLHCSCNDMIQLTCLKRESACEHVQPKHLLPRQCAAALCSVRTSTAACCCGALTTSCTDDQAGQSAWLAQVEQIKSRKLTSHCVPPVQFSGCVLLQGRLQTCSQ